jgi:hypothetical protein
MAPLSAEQHALMFEIVRRHGLEPHVDAIAALGRPASRVVSRGRDDYTSVGTTRFGGDPDLPPEVPWPSTTSGLLPGAAIFIAQLELGVIPVAPRGMPSDGLLSLFVQGTEAAAHPVHVHAFHFPTGAALERRPSPPDDELCDEYLVGLQPVRVEWEPTVSFADWYSSGLMDTLAREEADSFFELLAELEGGLGSIAGHARDHNGADLRLSAVLEREGHPLVESVAMFETRDQLEALLRAPDLSQHRRSELTRLRAESDWWFRQRERLLTECERWHCVLRVDSNREMGLAINDADPLFILGHEDDLAAGRFDRLVGRVLQG